jgi:hypothetical protein
MNCTIIASASTTVGRRKRNEDAYVLDADLGLFAVADGMGGYSGGEVASHLAVTALAEFWAASVDTDNTWPYAFDRSLGIHENRIDAAVRLANRRICARREGELRNMGSTLAALIVRPRAAIVRPPRRQPDLPPAPRRQRPAAHPADPRPLALRAIARVRRPRPPAARSSSPTPTSSRGPSAPLEPTAPSCAPSTSRTATSTCCAATASAASSAPTRSPPCSPTPRSSRSPTSSSTPPTAGSKDNITAIVVRVQQRP